MPIEGVDRKKYLETKFGSRDLADKAYKPVLEHANLAGLNLNLEDIAKTPNTISSHRLILWAWQEGVQNVVVSALFKAYFVEGRDIGKNAVLVDISHNAGISGDLVSRLLAGKNDLEKVIELDNAARKMGVNSAPTFILNGKHVITGAQNVEFWSNLIIEVKDNIGA
jgi:predicted DsbA family dithiol-disulfide isomerase